MTLSAFGLTALVVTALAVVSVSPFVLLYLLIKDLRNRTSW